MMLFGNGAILVAMHEPNDVSVGDGFPQVGDIPNHSRTSRVLANPVLLHLKHING